MRTATLWLCLLFCPTLAGLILPTLAGCGNGADAPLASGGASAGGASTGGAGSGGTSTGASAPGGTHQGGSAAGGGESQGGSGTGGQSQGGSGQGGSGQGGSAPAGRVRVVAANLTSGNYQSYDLGHGVRILQGLDADVILIQEFNQGDNTAQDINGLVDTICSSQCTYVRGPAVGIPNGVISRYPIVASGHVVDPMVSNRTFVWARLDVPGPTDLWAISVHFLTSGASNRNQEANALLSFIQGSIPAADLVVLGGDFNTDNRTQACIGTLALIFDVEGPHPMDQLGVEGTNASRSDPYDWVLADDDLRPKQIPVLIGQTTFMSGAVIDTRVYQPLSEIAPAQYGDSEAPSMQHMAVVKDFYLE